LTRFAAKKQKGAILSADQLIKQRKKEKQGMFNNVTEMFDKLRERFNAEKARGDNAVIAFDLRGEGGGAFWLQVRDGALSLGEGTPPAEADAILRAEAADLMKIMGGELNPMMAFMSGKVKVERNMGIMMKLMGWFGL
jgi:putative sterol carrier protein